MAEKPSIVDRYKLQIPQPLQDAVDEIALNSPLVTETQADLDDYKKRWLVVGICLHSVIAPALRNYIVPILTVLYDELNRYHKIETQIYQTHLQKYPPTHAVLNYEAVNNNKGLYRYQKAKCDYTIKNAVELSKLFQPTHMAHYTGFDETCETSCLLELVINIDKFAPDVRSDAVEVRRRLRNPWAHCKFSEWDAAKYSNAFILMEKLVLDMNLSSNEEIQTIGKLKKWEINGEQFLSGTTVGLELVNELRQQTCVLGEYARQIATGADGNFTKINNELEKIQTLLINRIDQLQKDMEEIDKRVKAQDKIIENQHTQLADFNTNLNKCACHDFHNVDIELWKEQEAMFVETPVVEDISQILESDHSVLIVGEPGIGKSMLMHHIALKLHTTMNYTIIPCSAIQDIKHHYKEGIKQMFVFDDIVGRFTASLSDIEYLQKQEETFNRMLKKGKIKIAATCRLDIYSDEKFHASCTVFTSNIINLSNEYSKENKLKICAKYLTETSIQLLKDKNEVFTPLMCYLYSKNENFNLTDFLNCPYETYQNEWIKLKSIDPYKYCALFLCVLHNGIIKESLFDIYTENIDSKNLEWDTIFEVCGLNRGTSRCEMETVFDSIIGTYVRKIGNEYKVIHDQMFDFMCAYFGNKDTMVRCILRNACIQVLNERTQLESINEQRHKFTILITNKYEQEYFERILNELKLGNLEEFFYNPQMDHEKYRAFFIKVLQSIDDKLLFEEIHRGTFSKQFNESYLEFLILSCEQGYYDIVKFFISKNADLENMTPIASTTPLIAACEREHENIVQLLIVNGCNVHQYFDGKNPLTTACGGRNEKIVRLLIDKGCNVNGQNNIGEIPLVVACWGGNEKIVQLLIEKGCYVNGADGEGHTPLSAACEGRHENIVHLLIEKGCNVNQIDFIRQAPLTAACESGYEEIVQVLIDKGCNVHQVDGMGQTPLTAACGGGNEKIVHLLIDQGCLLNQVDCINQTPLTAACEGGQDKMVQLLITKGCHINQVDGIGQTPLTVACGEGNKKIVQLLIDKGCNINQADSKGKTPLSAACERGNEKIVQLLIDKGCNVKQADDIGQTPLTAACGEENKKIVQLLIDKGCSVNQADGQGQTPLTAACERGNEKIVQLLIDKGCNIQANGKGQTPMTASCKRGNEKIVQLLKDKGCNVKQANGKAQTPLTAACEKGNEKIVQLLIDKGCNVNQSNGQGQTPLTASCERGNEKIVQLLIDKGCNVNQANGKGQTPLTAACKIGNEKIVQLLIDKGCSVNQADDMGQTPLTAACEIGYEKKIVHLLLDKGCNVNQANGKGQTPLTAACEIGNEKIVQLLLDKGCNVNQVNGMGQTPLTAAFVWEREDIVQILVDKGCNVNHVDGMKQTPLIAACESRNGFIVHLLLDKGCNVNQVDSMGETALTAACKGGHKKIVQLIIDKECNVNQVDGMGETALTAACKGGNKKIVQLLLDKECNVNQVTGVGQTPLTAACEGRREKIVQLLLNKGCNVNQVDGVGKTPLTAACKGGHKKIVQLLIDKGCSVYQADGMRETPLTVACKGGYKKIVQFLIDKGCSVKQADGMGQTPLAAAYEGGHKKIVQILVDKGCNVNHVDGMRQTPLKDACEEGNENIVKLLINKDVK